MVVHHGRQQIVGRSNGVEVAGEVQVDLLHGQHLRIAAARSAALHAEYRAQRGLTQRQHGLFAQYGHAVGQAYADGGLALSGRGRIDGCHQNQPRPVRLCRIGRGVHLRHIASVGAKVFLIDARCPGNLCNGPHLCLLSNFNIRHADSSFKKLLRNEQASQQIHYTGKTRN